MHAITDIDKLAAFLELDEKNKKKVKASPFKLLLPLRLALKIPKNDIRHPLFRQFVPTADEKRKRQGFSLDPLQEKSFRKGLLLRKYAGRALLLASPCCAMHCRFCFRRNFPFEKCDFKKELAIISKDKTLSEIILSGGDPLTMEAKSLIALIKKLNGIKHIKRIRIHSRYLIADPKRIDPFLKTFKDLKKQLYFVVHVNHALELDEEIFRALDKIRGLKIPVLCQTVLLKGVNDNFSALYDLFSLLVDHGILPYYLHQLDKVEGAAHFETPIKKGLSLIKALKEKLPGYAVPRYVAERAHEKMKSSLYSS